MFLNVNAQDNVIVDTPSACSVIWLHNILWLESHIRVQFQCIKLIRMP